MHNNAAYLVKTARLRINDGAAYACRGSVPVMTIPRCLTASCILYASFVATSSAQWSPFGDVLDVVVTNNCSMTGGEIALVVSDGIFYCPSRAKIVDDQISDASHFYLVQAYGQLAIHKRSWKLADCWAAHQLAAAPNGRHYVRQWIRHWRAYGTWKAGYGSPEQRIDNVRSCCACGA